MKKYDNTILFLIMIFLNIIIILIQASSSLPHVYYINLDRAFKRNQNMKHYLTEYGFNYTRIEAFDGKDFVHDIETDKLYTYASEEGDTFIFSNVNTTWVDVKPPSKSEAACTLSHLS